jgi:predicted transcriptional regulator
MREINVIIIFGMHANNIYINQLAHMSTLLNREYYLSKDVGSIASRNYITLNEDNTVSDGVKLMRDSDISSIIITN